MEPSRFTPSDRYVRAFARGLSVILCFGPNSVAQSVSQVARAVGADRAGARRFLLTLEKLGYVRRQGRFFQLTPRILDLGYSYLSTLPLRSVAEPIVRELVQEVNESSSVSVLDGADIVYVVRVPVKKIMTITLSIGSRIPAYCSAMGRILLGGLPKKQVVTLLKRSVITRYTRYTLTSPQDIMEAVATDHAKGWSMCNQELEKGICSLAVPLVDREGRIVAAMNITANLSRTTSSEMVSKFLPSLKRSADVINSALRLR
jgi:IclR family pca regulon transcriptional regulator